MNLSNRTQLRIGAVLALLIAATHGHHFASYTHLPAATWAVFFLTGFYLRRVWVFAALLVEIVAIDYVAITFGGVNAFCVSPAYAFLLPAYGSLWLAGRWFAARYSFSWAAIAPFSGSLFAGALVSDLLSSGGFYFFSGRFVDPSLAEFGLRMVKYFPHALSSLAFWMGVAIAVHVTFSLVHNDAQRDLSA